MNITLVLTPQEVEMIVRGLSQLPIAMALPTFEKIKTQLEEYFATLPQDPDDEVKVIPIS